MRPWLRTDARSSLSHSLSFSQTPDPPSLSLNQIMDSSSFFSLFFSFFSFTLPFSLSLPLSLSISVYIDMCVCLAVAMGL